MSRCDPGTFANDSWGLATDPVGGYLYIGSRNGGAVSRYSLANPLAPTLLGRVPPGGNVFSVAVNKTTGDLYFVHTASNFSDRPANLMKRYSRAGALLASQTINFLDTFDGGGIAINRTNANRLYLAGTDYAPGTTDLVQIVANGLQYAAYAPYRLGPAQGIQPDPVGIAANEVTNRIYVGNRGNNTLTVIEDTEFIP